jgi:hypothetical protein
MIYAKYIKRDFLLLNEKDRTKADLFKKQIKNHKNPACLKCPWKTNMEFEAGLK